MRTPEIRPQSLRRIIVASLSIGWLVSGTAAAASLKPILPLASGSPKSLPLVEEGARDPEVLDRRVYDPSGAEERKQHVRSLENDLKSLSRAKPPKIKGSGKAAARARKRAADAIARQKQEVLAKIVDSYLSLAYYAADVVNGRIPFRGSKSSVASDLRKFRQNATNASGAYLKLDRRLKRRKKSPSTLRMEYHNVTVRYFLGQQRTTMLKRLKALAKARGLNAKLKRRADYLHSLDGVGQRRPRDVRTLGRLISGLPTDAAIAARLALARYEAGLDGQGNRAHRPAKRYKSLLYQATKRSEALSEGQKAVVLKFAMGVWRRAEGRNGSWAKPPIAFASLGKSASQMHAVKEREALDNFKRGRFGPALSVYKALSGKFARRPEAIAIDRRTLTIEESYYRKTRRFTGYEKALAHMIRKYSEESGQSKGRIVKTDAEARLKRLVSAELARATSKKVSRKGRDAAIRLGERYLSRLRDPREKVPILERLATLWAQNGVHANAVRIYKNLARKIDPKNKRKYYGLAINSQRTLAKWPRLPPWKGAPKGNPRARRDLMALYQEASKGAKGVDWPVTAHVGLLHMALGGTNRAFSIWEGALRKSHGTREAGMAAGIMLTSYNKAQNWQKMEALARLCQSKRIVAKDANGRPIDIRGMLAEALLGGGKKALAAKKYDVAVKKLKEYVWKFRSKKRDEGMHLLSLAYRGDKKHREAISTLIRFAKDYPKSKYFRQAMLNGANWAMPMAYEENALFFLNKFASRFPNDPETPKVREKIIPLYMGRQLYSQAAAHLRAKAESKKTSMREREEAQLAMISIDERYGDRARATKAAQKMLRTAKSDAAKVKALIVLTREASERGSKANLIRIEKELSNLSRNQTGDDALGHVRFLLARMNLKGLLEPILAPSLKDPIGTISSRQKQYKAARKWFSRVCDPENNAYCAPALYEIARLAERLLEVMEDVTIAETLPDKAIKKFEAKKSEIIGDLVRDAVQSDEKAVEIVERGYTSPDWTYRIYWESASEIGGDQVSGETASAFIQWTSAAN